MRITRGQVRLSAVPELRPLALASTFVGSDEWYRSAEWDVVAREAFEARLRRARDYNRPQYLKIKGLALLAAGQAVDGVALLHRVLDEYPDALDAAYCAETLADHHLANGDAREAEVHYRRALTLRPDQNGTSGEVHIGLAEALTAQQRYDDALHALELAPVTDLTLNHAACRWNAALADAASGRGEVQVARDAARRALALLDERDQFSRHPGVGRAALSDDQRRRLQVIQGSDEPGRSGRWWSMRRR